MVGHDRSALVRNVVEESDDVPAGKLMDWSISNTRLDVVVEDALVLLPASVPRPRIAFNEFVGDGCNRLPLPSVFEPLRCTVGGRVAAGSNLSRELLCLLPRLV